MSTTNGPTQRRYPPELRERAVRMVLETIKETGQRHGVVTNRELRRANEILRSAPAFFAAELDGRQPS